MLNINAKTCFLTVGCELAFDSDALLSKMRSLRNAKKKEPLHEMQMQEATAIAQNKTSPTVLEPEHSSCCVPHWCSVIRIVTLFHKSISTLQAALHNVRRKKQATPQCQRSRARHHMVAQ
jgi:hypothetical protein